MGAQQTQDNPDAANAYSKHWYEILKVLHILFDFFGIFCSPRLSTAAIHQVFLSLASSHNAVYRMVDGLRPLLEEFQVEAFIGITRLPSLVRCRRKEIPNLVVPSFLVLG